jgi:hypothetical protein
MENQPAGTRRRYAVIDAMNEASSLGTVIALEYSCPVQPDERNLKQLKMYAQGLANKLEKQFPNFPAVFFPDVDRNGKRVVRLKEL